MKIKDNRWIRVRIYITGASFLIALSVIFLRAYQLQILEGERLSSLAKDDYTGELILTPQRGTIFDRNGKELAISIDAASIYACPKRISDKGKTAHLVARALDIDKREVLKKLQGPRSFVWIKRKVTPEEIQRIKVLHLTGIHFTQESRRYYSCLEIGTHVIGFASQDNRGLEGIELQYNRYLEGRQIKLNRVHDALGRPLLFDGPRAEKHDPFNLILTLDKEISYEAQKALRRAVERSGARSGVCIVLRPQTGEILAMANVPECNPNIFWECNPEEWRNRAVTDCFEPGSTLKAFLLAAALEEGVVTPEKMLNCGKGTYRIGNYTIHDSKAFGSLPVSEIIKFSSNIGAIRIGNRLGARRFHDYLMRFGFGEQTGIDFPGERKGILKPVQEISTLGHNTRYFGQGLSVTPLQLAVAFGAIANGGKLMRPYLVRAIVDQKGETIREFYPLLRREVISSETAKEVRKILEGVVSEDGTAPKGAIDGYGAAGKTGTAQKVDPRHMTYSDKKFVAFFGGFAPAGAPAIVILVALDEPKGQPYGGLVAAPVFSEVGSWTLNHLNITPSAPRSLVYTAEKEKKTRFHTPEVLLGSMPDVKGLGIRDVLKTAKRLGLEVVVKGSGLAAEQTPAPGTPLTKGKLLTVTFRPPC
jgi:cell division protein FtsI (penicillin-binding protein 3)